MKRTLLTLTCTAFAILVQAGPRDMENSIPIKALGGSKYNDRNSAGSPCYDYSRANHDFRLEDVNVSAEPAKSGCRITAQFTITHLYRGLFNAPLRPADHFLVNFEAEAGTFKATVREQRGRNPWRDIVTLGLTAVTGDPASSAGIASFASRLSAQLSGGAEEFVKSDITNIVTELVRKSKHALYIIKVKTSDVPHAGTDDTASIEIEGSPATSNRAILNSANPLKDDFQRRETDRLLLFSDEIITFPQRVIVAKSGRNDWHLESVQIIAHGVNKTVSVNRWLGNSSARPSQVSADFQ